MRSVVARRTIPVIRTQALGRVTRFLTFFISTLSLGLAVMALQSVDNPKILPPTGGGLQDDSTSSGPVNAAQGESAKGEWTTVAGGTMPEVEITYDQCFREPSLFDLLLEKWRELSESSEGGAPKPATDADGDPI